MKIRVSVTDVEALRYFQSSETMELEALLRQLRREEPPSEKMLAGSAFHKLLEHSEPGTLEDTEIDGFQFQFDLDAEIALPPVRELKAEAIIPVNGVEVTLVGIVDAIQGCFIYDHKLTGQFDAERYAKAFQWRAYLYLLDCQVFTYNVFTGAKLRDGIWHVRAFDPLTFHRYVGMEGDVLRQLGEFVDFAQTHLPERLEL